MFKELATKLHFPSDHSYYYSAWKYTIKFASAYEQFEKHHDLTQDISPKTKRAINSCISYKEQLQMSQK